MRALGAADQTTKEKSVKAGHLPIVVDLDGTLTPTDRTCCACPFGC